jgi:hypothetical protein
MNLQKYSNRAGGLPPDELVALYGNSLFEDQEEDEQYEDGEEEEYAEDEYEDYGDLDEDEDPVPSEVIPADNALPEKMTRSAEKLPFVDTSVRDAVFAAHAARLAQQEPWRVPGPRSERLREHPRVHQHAGIPPRGRQGWEHYLCCEHRQLSSNCFVSVHTRLFDLRKLKFL